MRDEYAAFTARDAEILAIGPEGVNDYKRYWMAHQIPYVGLPDPKHVVANLYQQEVNLWKLGRMPALMVVDKNGIVQYQHYANNMQDIPANKVVFDVLDRLNQ